MTVQTTEVNVKTGCKDRKGRLVWIDDELIAVLVQLTDEIHGDQCGRWNVEAFFHRIGHTSTTFTTEAEAINWIQTENIKSAWVPRVVSSGSR